MTTHPSAPSTPPTSPAPLEPDPPMWPRVVGCISIGLGALPLCGLACSSIVPLLGLPNNAAVYSGVVKTSQTWSVIGTVIGTGNTLLLITAGIMLLRRKPQARTLHMVWAVISVVMTLIAMVTTFLALPEMLAWAKANPQDPAAQNLNRPGVQAFAYVMAMAMMLVALAWPTFCLIWFGLLGRGRAELAAKGNPRPMAFPGERR